MDYWIIAIVAGFGAVDGFANVFVGDVGFHLPRTKDGVWQAGVLGVVVCGAIAAVASWATLKVTDLTGPSVTALSLTTGDTAFALVIGFCGARWFRSESEKNMLKQAAAIAAGKNADAEAARKIARASPFEALRIANHIGGPAEGINQSSGT